jgi:endo-1,4-beta-mannosidase
VTILPRGVTAYVASPIQPTDGFITRSGTGLTLNGAPYRFDGLNIYAVNSDGGCVPASNVNSDLDALSGQEVFRAFFFQTWATTNGVRDWSRFDATIAAAAAHNMRVIPVLANEWNYCDGPMKYLPWWQSGYKTTVNPGELTSYRQWVHDIVSRYAANPTIAMWDLVNEGEGRNADGSCSEANAKATLVNFSNDVGGMVHALDPNHIVTLGTISGECGSVDNDYQTVYASPGSDLCDYHDYGFVTSPMGNTDAYNGVAASLRRCEADGKPLAVLEMGIRGKRLTTRSTLFDKKFAAEFAAGSVGNLMWDYAAHPYGSYEIGPQDPSVTLVKTY